MADGTPIEWTDATWNPIVGCSVVSAGCRHCYAMRLAGTRLRHHPTRKGLTDDTKAGPVWNGQVRFNEAELVKPLSWRRPRRIFVCAHGDLFHENVPDEWIDRVFAVMALAPQHTFQVLTKRPERMRDYAKLAMGDFKNAAGERVTRAVNFALMTSKRTWGQCGSTSTHITTMIGRTGAREPGRLRKGPTGDVERLIRWTETGEEWLKVGDDFARMILDRYGDRVGQFGWGLKEWPFFRVWLGVSVEDQATANERIPILLDTPATVRWISAEPLLGPVDLDDIQVPAGAGTDHFSALYIDVHPEDDPYHGATIDWVVAGGESGPGARPMHPDWARSLRDQCAAAGVPFLFKQWGEWAPADAFGVLQDGPVTTRGGDVRNWMKRYVVCADRADRLDAHSFTGHATGLVYRVGKTRAGRLLDGVLHDAFPEVRHG